MISAKKPMPESVSHDVRESILDTYVREFLDLPEQFSEKNLRKAIIENLKQFILEFGRDFTFIGEGVPCSGRQYRFLHRLAVL